MTEEKKITTFDEYNNAAVEFWLKLGTKVTAGKEITPAYIANIRADYMEFTAGVLREMAEAGASATEIGQVMANDAEHLNLDGNSITELALVDFLTGGVK